MAATPSEAIINSWLSSQKGHTVGTNQDNPNYYTSNLESLVTVSSPQDFTLGTGAQILSSVLKSCVSTSYELIIVTCFWAKSKSQQDVSSLLRKLSRKALSQNRKIRVRLCFSSISIMQKLSQTSSLDGKLYPISRWQTIGLPNPAQLRGLDLVVKSVFVKPFSVMHPKFILIDRQRAFMPSCNVSWEEWFEGFIEVRGSIAGKLFDFWSAFWGRGGSELPASISEDPGSFFISKSEVPLSAPTIPTILLPSPHHTTPQFRPFSSSFPAPPSTALNSFLLHIFRSAKDSIFIQTPNLTCRPVIAALISALGRGVNVHINTSRRLMILEQLVTAGTITEFEIWKLQRRYASLLKEYEAMVREDPEVGVSRPGALTVGFFKKISTAGNDLAGEPVKSHLKLTIVDDDIVVLGSGNMDRASWYTSQELGIAFFSRDMAKEIRESVEQHLDGRLHYVC